jgi:hypothetical protein
VPNAGFVVIDVQSQIEVGIRRQTDPTLPDSLQGLHIGRGRPTRLNRI